MGNAYYYFAASLPSLEFEGKIPFTTDEFLAHAQRLLIKDDFDILEAFVHIKEIELKNKVLQEWDQIRHNIRNGWAIFRAAKANKDPLQYQRGEYYEDPFVEGLIQQADKASDPLEAEKILSKAYWKILEDLEVGQYFNLEFILIYAVKLRILERYHVIHSPKGKDMYETLKKIEFPEGIASGIA